jgi:WD40 repeat protein
MQLVLRIARPWSIAMVIWLAVVSAGDFSIVRPTAADSNPRIPITDLLVLDERIYSCSQAGLFHTNFDGSDSQELKAIPFRIYALAEVAGDSDKIAVGGGRPGESGVIAILSSESGKILAKRTVSKDLVYSISIDAGTRTIAAACNDGSIVTVPLSDLQNAAITTRHRHTAIARDVVFSPDGRWLASAGHDGLVLISAWPPKPDESMTEVRSLAGHTDQVHCLTFSPDSRIVASGSKDGKLRLHKVEGPLLRTYAELAGGIVSGILWSKDLGRFATTLNGTVHELSENDDSSSTLAEFPDPAFSLTELPNSRLAAASYQVEILTTPSSRHRPADSAR